MHPTEVSPPSWNWRFSEREEGRNEWEGRRWNWWIQWAFRVVSCRFDRWLALGSKGPELRSYLMKKKKKTIPFSGGKAFPVELSGILHRQSDVFFLLKNNDKTAIKKSFPMLLALAQLVKSFRDFFVEDRSIKFIEARIELSSASNYRLSRTMHQKIKFKRDDRAR